MLWVFIKNASVNHSLPEATKEREMRNNSDKTNYKYEKKKSKRKVQGVPQSQTTALPRHQKEEETDNTKQAQIEQTYEKHLD